MAAATPTTRSAATASASTRRLPLGAFVAISPLFCASGRRRLRRVAERLRRRHEVVRAGERGRVARQRVAGSVVQARHALEHLDERPLLGAEADEHRSVHGHGAVGHVAAEDLAEVVLIGAGDVRVGRLVFELDAVGLAPADHQLLLRIGERLPLRRVVLPLLQEQDRSPGALFPVRHEHVLRRVDQIRVLGAVDEARHVEVMPVRPARRLLCDRRDSGERANRHPRDVEDDVVRAARDPEHRVVLRRGHDESVHPGDRLAETVELDRRVVGHRLAPELGPEAGDEVDAPHRRSWLAQRRHRSYDLLRASAGGCVELEVRVRTRAQRENAALRSAHGAIVAPRTGPSAALAHWASRSGIIGLPHAPDDRVGNARDPRARPRLDSSSRVERRTWTVRSPNRLERGHLRRQRRRHRNKAADSRRSQGDRPGLVAGRNEDRLLPLGGRPLPIFVMNADGTNAAQVTWGDSSASDAAWSPDGRRIAFTRCSAGSCDIHVMNADGCGAQRLTHGERPGAWDPTWSQDGRRLAFAEIGGIVVMSTDGRDRKRVTDGPADDNNPDWSPVGRKIAFDGSRSLWDGDIYVVEPDATRMTNLTDSQPLDSNPSWSPEGDKIAFMRKRNRYVRARLFVMNADGSPQTSLGAIGDDYSRPSWAPDGARLAYSWLTACIVPKVAGMRLADARERILRASCSVGAVRFAISRGPRGIVVAQRPQARAERLIGTKVRLAVSVRR